MSDFTALIPSNAVEINGERAYTTSLIVAEVFGKKHAHVLRDIDRLDCPDDFRGRNFALTFREVDPSKSVHNSAASKFGFRKERYFEIAKDGLVFLVMGYRGKKAADLKIAYIERFNAMEAQFRQGAPIDPTPLEEGVHRVLEVEFQGDTLYLIDADGTPYVHAESIRAGSRLPWYPTRHELRVLYEPLLKTLAVRFPDGAVVPMHECLPLRKLPGWLAKGFMHYGRFEYRSPEYLRLRAYFDHADDAPWAAWDAYLRQMPPALPDVDGSEWVTIRREDLRQMTTGIAALNVLLDHGMRGVDAVEASTGELWYGRPTEVRRG